MIAFFKHRGCYGLQVFRIGRWTAAFWWVPRDTKLAPHQHPGQTVIIIPLVCIRTTFNVCPMGGFPKQVRTRRAWPLGIYVTPDGCFHFANKSDPRRERVGPFVFFNIIKWKGQPRPPRDGFRVIEGIG